MKLRIIVLSILIGAVLLIPNFSPMSASANAERAEAHLEADKERLGQWHRYRVSDRNVGPVNFYYYFRTIYPDNYDTEQVIIWGYSDIVGFAQHDVKRRTGITLTSELSFIVYKDWDTMKKFAPNPDVELPSLSIGRGTVLINNDYSQEDVYATIRREANRMLHEEVMLFKYDFDDNGAVDKSEIIEVIDSYLFSSPEGVVYTKEEVIEAINFYLFGA